MFCGLLLLFMQLRRRANASAILEMRRLMPGLLRQNDTYIITRETGMFCVSAFEVAMGLLLSDPAS